MLHPLTGGGGDLFHLYKKQFLIRITARRENTITNIKTTLQNKPHLLIKQEAAWKTPRVNCNASDFIARHKHVQLGGANA